MTKEDIARMVYVIKSTYQNQFKDYDNTMMQNMIDAWTMVFADKDVDEVFKGLQIYLSSDKKGFAPSPGQVVDCMHRLRPKVANEMEAWNIVDKAVRNSIYGAQEEFNKLPQIIRRVVRNPGRLREWAVMDCEAYQTVEQSNFMRAYRTEVEREKQNELIPKKIRPMLENIGDSIPMIETVTDREEVFSPDTEIEELISQLNS